MRARLLFLLLPVHVLVAACGQGDPTPVQPTRSASLRVRNRSQFELTSLRIHPGLDHRGSPELLDAPLPVEGDVLAYPPDGLHVTVLREAYARGPLRAFTTAEPLRLDAGRGHVLSVFDESFRLEGDTWADPARADVQIVLAPTSTAAGDP